MRVTVYTSGTGTHTTRPPVVTAFIRAWGGGGAGGGASGNPATGGGGAGGQRAEKLDTVTGGTGYAYSVGAAATGSATLTVNGNDTTWRTTVCVAKGGAGAAPQAGNTAGPGASGSTASGVGDTVVAGGNGGTAPSTANSGGGGGGGGGNASGGTAGVATAPGGNGGAGRTTSGAGNAGTAFGGGGSGGYANTTTDRAGGNGAAGGLHVLELDQRDLLCLGCG